MSHTRNTSGPRFTGPPIVSQLADDPEMIELIELFVSELPERGDKMLSAFSASNWPELSNEAHKLRGSSASHGFAGIGELAAQIEEATHELRKQGLAGAQTLRDQVHELAGMCHRALAHEPQGGTGEGRIA